MIDSQKTIKLASELNRLTKRGELQWHAERAIRPSGEGYVRFAYSTRHEGVSLVIFERVQRHYEPDSESFFSESAGITLAILGEGGMTEFEFPQVPGIDDLFSSIRYQVANRSGAVDKLIGALAK